MDCPKCQGSMSSKTIQYKGQPKQIFECDQANGECLNDKGYPNSVWPRGGGGAKASAPTRSAPKSSNGGKESYWERKEQRDLEQQPRIERQHSQEMAIRFVQMQDASMIGRGEKPIALTTDKLRMMIDWFQRDIGYTALAHNANTPKSREEEPERPPHTAEDDTDIPF